MYLTFFTTVVREVFYINTLVTSEVPWDPTAVFAYFTTMASIFLTAVMYYHSLRYASFDAKKKIK